MRRAWLIAIALSARSAAADPQSAPPAGSKAAPGRSHPSQPDRAQPTRSAPTPTDATPPSTSRGGTPPPSTSAAERDDDLVDVSAVIADAVIDIRYATADNFTGKALYPVARCKLRRAVAARLAKAATALRAQDRRLVLWDCYRPRSIQQELWRRVPDPRYVADPRLGSKHGRGAAVDVALVDRAGKPIVLPTQFDDFSEAAHRDHALAGEPGAEARRLEAAMAGAGFKPLATEWWHFDAPDSASYPLSDQPL